MKPTEICLFKFKTRRTKKSKWLQQKIFSVDLYLYVAQSGSCKRSDYVFTFQIPYSKVNILLALLSAQFIINFILFEVDVAF